MCHPRSVLLTCVKNKVFCSHSVKSSRILEVFVVPNPCMVRTEWWETCSGLDHEDQNLKEVMNCWLYLSNYTSYFTERVELFGEAFCILLLMTHYSCSRSKVWVFLFFFFQQKYVVSGTNLWYQMCLFFKPIKIMKWNKNRMFCLSHRVWPHEGVRACIGESFLSFFLLQ